MRRMLMVLTLPPGYRDATSTSCLRSTRPSADEVELKARDIQALRHEEEQPSVEGLAPFRPFAGRVGDGMAGRPGPQPDGRDPLWRETLWSLGLLMAAAFLVFLIAETAPR